MRRASPRVQLPPRDRYRGAGVEFAVAVARGMFAGAGGLLAPGVAGASVPLPYPLGGGLDSFRTAVDAALSMVLSAHSGGKSEEFVALEVREIEGRLVIDIFNRGLPILLNGGQDAGFNSAYLPLFREASRHCEKISILNSGRKGQTVSLEFRLAGARTPGPAPAQEPAAASIPEGEELQVRGLRPGEEEALSRLFYLVYGYDYINETVYDPDKLRALAAAGDLISIVAARPNGRLVGHVGLVRKNKQPPVFEAAMGVVDPALKSRGVFGRLFQKTMEMTDELPMRYCFFDFVTNHELTQRHVGKYGSCDLALFIGCQIRETQARLPKLGLGKDPEAGRYSLLVSVLPKAEHPFGREISLPENIGGPYGFLLKPLGLSWSPAPRFSALAAGGRYATSCQNAQSAAVFDMEEPGLAAVEGVLQEWRELLREGYQYAAIDIPLDRPGAGPLYDRISSEGFFAAGFIPYRFTDRLGFRFQSLGPTKAAFDAVKVASDPAKKLLKLIRQDYEASCLV